MNCPICELKENLEMVGDSHYICHTETCHPHDRPMEHTQFAVVLDKEILFPFTQIFPKRKKTEFYKKKYIEPEVFEF